MAEWKQNNPCNRCGSTKFIRRWISRWTLREYCAVCEKWKRFYTERVDDGKNMPSHCGKCKYFSANVFEGETENGWASWDGDCTHQEAPYANMKSRYTGCDYGELLEKRNKTE